MSLKLSHSATNRYTDCAQSYKYHYIDGYRAKVQSSALLFGSAIDRAAEHYAISRNFEETIDVFKKTWQIQEINKKSEDLRFLLNFTYSDRDMDLELLKFEDWLELEKVDSHPKENIQKVVDKKKKVGYKYLKKEEKVFFNFTNWLCLKHKGLYMLIEFKDIFDKNVEEVLGTQVKIDLENDNDDSVTGFADLVVRWRGIKKPVVIDLKTSSIDYQDDSIKTSAQLSLYVFSLSEKYENTRNAGYIVLNKNIQKNKTKICKKCGYDGSGKQHKTCDNLVDEKRCHGEWLEVINPKARSQVIIDEISEIMAERTIENFDMVNKSIKAEIFPRNFNSCYRFNNTVRCQFYEICHSKDYTEVIKKVKE